MKFRLQPLPYDTDALEPALSERQLGLHHGKHHAAYVEKLNELIRGTPYDGKSLEDIITSSARQADAKSIFNNAAQIWNHDFFWNSMSPDGGGEPGGELHDAIEDAFGSLRAFREKFIGQAFGHFASGWAWLVIDAGKLAVITTHDAENPLITGQFPLLCCDLWEHAYYLDYENKRKKFVKAFIDELVDWNGAAERMAMQGEGNKVAARRYQDRQAEFARSPGRVAQKAHEAAEALDGPEGAALEEARRRTARIGRGERPGKRST